MHTKIQDMELESTLRTPLQDKLLLELVQTSYEAYRNNLSTTLELLLTFKNKSVFVLALNNAVVDIKEQVKRVFQANKNHDMS